METLSTLVESEIKRLNIGKGILCKTYKQFNHILKIFKVKGYKWGNEINKEEEKRIYNVNKGETILHIDKDFIEYSNVEWCKRKKIDYIYYNEYIKCLK